MKNIQNGEAVDIKDFVYNYTKHSLEGQLSLTDIYRRYRNLYPTSKIKREQFGSLFVVMCKEHHKGKIISSKSRNRSKVYHINVLKQPTISGTYTLFNLLIYLYILILIYIYIYMDVYVQSLLYIYDICSYECIYV